MKGGRGRTTRNLHEEVLKKTPVDFYLLLHFSVEFTGC